jgi:putative transcriptional regulator
MWGNQSWLPPPSGGALSATVRNQAAFAARYHIPLGTLRDWEQGRAEPDQPTLAYLTLIARDPDHVNRTLNPKAS